jgi:hypothetical protein
MIIDFEEGYAPEEGGSKRKMRGPIALSALVVLGALFLQNTLSLLEAVLHLSSDKVSRSQLHVLEAPI